ncbi:MAG: ATP-dependent zinc metalloprotease FtsH [Caldilineaceae bacterium]
MSKPPSRFKNEQDEEKERQERMQRQMRSAIGYVLAGLIILWLFQEFILGPLALRATEISYSEFRQKLTAGQLVNLTIGDTIITGEMKNPQANATPATLPFETNVVSGSDPNLVADLQKANVQYRFQRPANPIGGLLLAYVLPLVLIGGFWYFAMSRMRNAAGGGGLGGIFGIGRSRATEVKAEEAGATFKDVGGADEAIGELQEIIQFLKTPEKFAKLGGHIPKGVLLVGPPGTGKTLLARATAGEAGVPFFETSGAEFVEMFVGVGAARVRDLFEKARQAAPAVVFIDEIDAIGQSRGGAIRLGTNEEREQTLNQLLAEIDGFNTNVHRPVIIMAATNRPEVLDPALLRPGRFDRQVTIGNPDLKGRIQILRIHSRDIKLAPDFDLEQAARITPGFSGADLENVMNEAALLAARRNADAVTLGDFQAALERVVAGLEQKNRVLNAQERNTVAYHEAGHALVAELTPYGDPVSKISIVPRSRGALGYTMQMPTEDRYLLTIEELQDRLAIMLGGRAAEKIVFSRISTGASDDITKATELARRMVTEFGMSDKLGSVRYAGQQLRYLDGAVGENTDLSPETRELIDSEVQRFITEQYERAISLLEQHRTPLETLAQQLLTQETVDGSAVKQALDGALAPA